MSRAVVLVALLLACNPGAPGAQRSPDGRYALTSSFYDGTLVQLTVTDHGKVVDTANTQDTNQMKWVDGTTRDFDATDSVACRHRDNCLMPK